MGVVQAADLFCGAGGTSSGLIKACQEIGTDVDLLAINHWQLAIETHSQNHPEVRHLCETLDSVNPRKVVPGGRLNLLVASPECTHHSIARGGRPVNDQSRASAWHIIRWAEAIYIDNILVENVVEFRNWGPIGANGRPLKSRRGETYRAFLRALESLGYRVEDRVLNAADYGDPTTRRRLFIIARRGNRRIRWPEPTHSQAGQPDLFGDRKPWKPAREIIDWSIPGKSIFRRKRPLAKKTLKRIEAGLKKFGGENAEPFLLVLRRHADARSLDEPLPTLTAGGQHLGLVQPFILPHRTFHNMNADSIHEPLRTITANSADFALVQPFLVKYFGTAEAHSIDDPIDTITSKDRFGLVEPKGGQVGVDILFRMLQPHELARAMSFDPGYKFAGNRTDQVKQIGNAVPVRLAKALCRSLLEDMTESRERKAG